MGRLEHTESQKKLGVRLAMRIKTSREKSSYTQEELASKSQISIDTLRKLEGGRVAAPSVFLISKLARILNVKLEDWLK